MDKRKLNPAFKRRMLTDQTRRQFEGEYGSGLTDEDLIEIIHSLKSFSQVLLDIDADRTREVKNEN